MSDKVSALQGAAFEGIARVEEAGFRGMVTFRGDLTAAKVKTAVKAASGVAIPGQRGIAMSGEGGAAAATGAAWMSPDELLILVPHAEADAAVATLTEKLGGTHFMAENVSDARAVFTVTGGKAREVIGKLAPVDMGAFGQGEIRRTRFAQVPAALWMHGEEAFTIVCFRSVAEYMFGLLKAAAQEGSEVGVY